jgi:hypothetical protein
VETERECNGALEGEADMATIEGEITIHRPVEVVFDFVADQTNEPQYNPDMVRAAKDTPGPVGKGTRFRSAVRSGGRTADMLIEITDFDRPVLLGSTTTMKQLDIEYQLRFDAVAAGTRMRWTGRVRPKGAFRMLGPLVSWMGNRQEERIWASLKSHLEGPPDAGSSD